MRIKISTGNISFPKRRAMVWYDRPRRGKKEIRENESFFQKVDECYKRKEALQ